MTNEELAARCRYALIKHYPYLATAIFRSEIKFDNRVPTACISQRGEMTCNEEFVSSLELPQLGAIMAHELWHVLRRHFERMESREPQLWNISADCEINDDLDGLPDDCMLPSLFKLPEDEVSEFYYDKLLNHPQIKRVPVLVVGSGSDGIPKEWEDQNAGELEGEKLKQVAQDVAMEISKNPGNYTKGLNRWADSIIKPPKIPWNIALKRELIKKAMSKDDFSFSRPKERDDILFPSAISNIINVTVLIDVSGSVEPDQLGHARGLIQEALRRNCNVTWISADTEIKTKGKGDLKGKDLSGGGGTDMRSVLKQIENGKDQPDLVITVTDGYTPWPSKFSIPHITLLFDKGGAKPVFGKTLMV